MDQRRSLHHPTPSLGKDGGQTGDVSRGCSGRQRLGGSGVAPTERGGVASHARGPRPCGSFSTPLSVFLTLHERVTTSTAGLNVPE
jgi:hypothetical protein